MIVRPATLADVPALVAIQNHIIRIGGTTAHQTEMSSQKFIALYMTAPDSICCHLAEDALGIIGFQAFDYDDRMPKGWAGIGSFISPDRQRTGAGHALFAATLAVARALNIPTINATIRADNIPGLGFYSRLGFVDYAANPDWALNDGRVVGRVSKRFDLT